MGKTYRTDTIEAVKKLRLLDDILFAEMAKDIKCVQRILRTVLDKEDLVVEKCNSQESIRFYENRSVILDCLASDSTGKVYNIEVQRSNEGATPLRVRYHASALSVNDLEHGQDFKDLRETYVIFITEHDVLRMGEAIYHINRTVRETGESFGDKESVLYINGEYIGNDPIGLLMADFRTTVPEDMHYTELREKTKKLKGEMEESKSMCDTVENLCQKRAAEALAEERADLLDKLSKMYKADELTLTAACALAKMSAADFEALVSNN